MDKDAARQQIATLVARYADLTKRDKAAMNEQTIRLQFILPLFRALGWDIEDPRDMTAEEQIASGFVDFGFYLNGVPAFYLETKKPAESLDKPDHKRQAINYAYLRGVAWAVLTNFSDLIVFNAEWKGDIHQAQFLTLHHADYAGEHFDRLWLLSKPAMGARALDRFAESVGKKDKKKPVNKVLLDQLLDWRERLFRNIRLYPENQQLWATPHEIDNAIQKLFDRLIFLRSVEDRGVDDHYLASLKNSARRADLFPALKKLFRDMNGVYNSNLFADHTLDGLTIHDGELVYRLLDGLYTGKEGGYSIKYDFAAIGADILGAVYEQYLGYKVQDPDPDKPRLIDPDAAPARRSRAAQTSRQTKRKLQGIYYTPQYIVRYIVEQTVGRLLADGADAHALRVVDPACGSGSFLIEAFDLLDRWLEKHEPDVPAHERRRRILTENLYGVDLDDQAVEVTRLNLTLRASLRRERLPMLHHIRCADSLRADWTDLFPDVSAAGGFDAVIGNPPYVRQETLGADFKTYAQGCFETYAGTADLYVYFIEKGVKLLRDGGLYGVIVANKWLRAAYGKPLRQFLKRESLQAIIDFGDLPVFEEAIAYPCIITVKRGKNGETVQATQVKTLDFDDLGVYVKANQYTVRRADLSDSGWSLAGNNAQNILTKLSKASITLGEYVNGRFFYGVKTGYTDAFVISPTIRQLLIEQDPKSAELIKPFLLGRDVKRYEIPEVIRYVIFTRRGIDISDYPAIEKYLGAFRERLEPKPDGWQGEWKGRKAGIYKWYETQDPVAYYAEFEKPKIVYLRFQTKPAFTLDTEGNYHNDAVWFLGIDDKYLLGVLNSKLGWFSISNYCTQIQGGYQLIWDYLKKIPIRRPNMDDPAEKALHDEIVTQVETILRLKREQADTAALFTDQQQELEYAIAAADRKIDAAVYALYGLTDAEIAVVEG